MWISAIKGEWLKFVGVLCLLTPIVVAKPALAQVVIPILEQSSDRAIIFIHGIGGDPQETFRGSAGKTWAQLMISDTSPLSGQPPLSAFDYYTVDYRAVFDARTSLEGAATNVVNAILASPAVQDHAFFWIIAHSMGGLITKRLIVELSRRPVAFDRLAAVLFLGVPANGSPLAGLAEDARLSLLLEWLGLNGRLVSDLKPSDVNTYLEGLGNQWDDVLGDRQREHRVLPLAYCAYETVPMVRYGPQLLQDYSIVVPKLYSEGHCFGRADPFPLTHASLVKPATRDDAVYIWARSKIRDSMLAVAAEPLVRQDKGQTLGSAVTYWREEHAKYEPGTGLPHVREDVRYGSEAASSTADNFEIGENVAGPSVADVLGKIAVSQPCVVLKVDKPHTNVIVGFSNGLKTCPATGTRLHCQTETCR